MQRTTLYLACIAASLLIWSQAARAERELDFAKGLMDKGFYDLSIEQYQLLEADEKATEDDRAQASLQLSDCYKKAAEAAAKPEIKDDFLSKAAEQLAAFLKKYKGRPEIGDARFRQALLNQQRGLDKDKLIQATPDAKVQAKLKEDAIKLFKGAADTFGDIVDELEKKLPRQNRFAQPDKQPDPKQMEILERYLLARGQMGWTYYYMSQVYSHDAKDKDLMKKYCLEAQNVFDPFLKEYPSYFITLWVQCGRGLAYRNMGDMEKAIDDFRRVIMKRRNEETNQIRYQAYYWLVETYRMTKQYDDSIRTANRFISEVPENFSQPIGWAIKIEKAKSYKEQADQYKKEKKDKEAGDNMAKAKDILTQVIKNADPEYRDLAGKLLGEWGLAKATGVAADHPAPLQVYTDASKAANEAKEAADKKDVKTAITKYNAALKSYRLTVEYADPEADAAMIADTWYNIGQCCYFLSQLRGNDITYSYSAGLAFEEVARRFPESQFASKAGYLAVVFFWQVYSASPAPKDYEADLYMKTTAFFVKQFPKDKEAPKLAAQVGDVLFNQKRFAEAADIYGQIPSYSPYYERCCYMAGNSYWLAYLDLLGQDPDKAKTPEGQRLRERAISRLTEFIDYMAKAPAIGPKEDAERKRWVALARVRLAGIYVDELVKQPQPALDVLKEYETIYPTETNSFPEVACIRVQALVWTGKLPDALAQMKNLIEKYKGDAKAVSKACRTVGSACTGVATDPVQQQKLAKDVLEAYRANATYYLNLSIKLYPDQPFGDYLWVGDKLRDLGDATGAIGMYVQARTKYAKEIPVSVQWKTVEKEADALFFVKDFKGALERYQQIDDFVNRDKSKAMVLAYKDKLGICYENMQQWQDALDKAWNILNDKLPQATPKWYEAKIHQIRCMAKTGDTVNAKRNLIMAANIYWDSLSPELKQQFQDLLKDVPDAKEEFDKVTKKPEK